MNRRFFLRSLGALLASASVAAPVFAAASETRPQGPVRPFKHALTPSGLSVAVLNPDWVNAPYEICFLHSVCLEAPSFERVAYPLRFRSEEDAREYLFKQDAAILRHRISDIRPQDTFAESLTRSLRSV